MTLRKANNGRVLPEVVLLFAFRIGNRIYFLLCCFHEIIFTLDVYRSNIHDRLIDFGLITGFEWDKGNERKSVDAHQVAQFEAEELFFNQPLIVTDDPAHSARSRAGTRWESPSAAGSCT